MYNRILTYIVVYVNIRKDSETKMKKMNVKEKLDNFRLSNIARKTNFKKDSYRYKKVDNNLDTQITIDKINSENMKLQAINGSMKNKIENAKMKCQLSKIDRAIDYNDTVAREEKKEIKNTLKKSKRFKRGSMLTCLISSITTCYGLYNQQDTIYVETFGFQVIALLTIGFFVNVILNELSYFKDKFYQKNLKGDKAFTVFMIAVISAYTTYSIYTNYFFWSKYFVGAGLMLISFIYDGISIVLSMLGYYYGTLRFNEKTKREINKALEIETQKEEKEETEETEEKEKEEKKDKEKDKIIELKKKKKA